MAVDDRPAWDAAQAAVIGALLLNADENAGKIFRSAKASYFGTESLRHIFESAQGLWFERRPIDVLTVLHAAGNEYSDRLAECMNIAPAPGMLDEYLHILRDEARLSAISSAASPILWAKSEAEALEAYEKLGKILRDTDTIEDLSWEEMVGRYLDRMNDPAPPNYLSFGIPQLDETLFVSPGDFCVLAADSSTGKTALALQLAFHMASSGKRVLFFSLETSMEKLEDRLMSEKQVAGVPMLHSKKRALTDDDYLRSTDAGMHAGKIPLRVIRRAETLAQIENRIVMHAADVVFIDYLQIINHRSPRGRVEAVAEISMELHRMANRLGVTIVALSQVTPPDSGKITINDLRESNQIKQDAEVILLLMKDKTFPGARRLVIGKDKDGATNRNLLLAFDPQHMTFSYAKRKEPSQVPGQGAAMWDLDEDDQGGEENPFDK